MKKNLLFIQFCVLIVCLCGGAVNSFAGRDVNFKGHRTICESKNHFMRNAVKERFHDEKRELTLAVKNKFGNLSVSSLVELYDSMYFWHYDTASSGWFTAPYQKLVNIQYDVHYNFLGYTQQHWDGSAWVNEYNDIETYDANNNWTSDILLQWNGTGWDSLYQDIFNYDINNDLTSDLYQNWNGSSWDNIQQDFFTYDASHNMLTSMYQSWNGSGWDNGGQNIYTYDVNNNNISVLFQSWNGSWTDDSRDSLAYDANNNNTFISDQSWNGSSWDDANRTTLTYDVNNNLTDRLRENWSGISWENYYQYIYTYAANNRLTQLRQLWDGTAWVNSSFYSYTYDANNFQLSSASLSYDFTSGAVSHGDSTYYYFHTATGIANVAAANEGIVVFPDPAGDALTVSGSVLDELSAIEIFDAAGKIVYSSAFPKSVIFEKVNIDVSKLNKGIYFAEFLCGKNVYRRKFVKG